ncbi:MAG: 5-formyltetrahydrofolate cyclo-ligase [Candidatus Rickettsia vulgarisii]
MQTKFYIKLFMFKIHKQNLRTHYKTIIKENISKIQLAETQLIIINKLNQLVDKLQVKHIGIYYPSQYEINLLGLLKTRTDLLFSLPKIVDKEIIYTQYHLGDKLVKNQFNVYESENTIQTYPKLICVPGLAFDIEGYRLGYGGGFFDRYLSKYSSEIISVGICLKGQLLNDLPVEDFDQKVNYILTEDLN